MFLWLVMGDFNNVFSVYEKANGLPVTAYELKDPLNCIRHTRLIDVRYSGSYLTWSNNRTWSKLDRTMVNHAWVDAGWECQAKFRNRGYLSPLV